MNNIISSQRNFRRFLIGALICVAVIRVFTLGCYAVMDKTEARYAEIAREMVATDNWISPQLDPGIPFWGKPPLSIWLTALSLKIFGINEFAARFPAFLLAVFICFLVHSLGTKLKGKDFGLISTAVLATTGFFFVLAGSVMTDPALTACMTLSMVAFVQALEAQDSKKKRLWGYAFFVGLGFNLLAKGPVGWVLTFFPVIVWTIWHRQEKHVFQSLPWFTGLILAFIIAVPWHIAAENKTPGFLEYYIIGEHWKRFTQSGWAGDLYGSAHSQPRGMIWPLLIPATLPWTVVLVPVAVWAWKRGQRFKDVLKDRWLSYVLFWFLSPLIFFTLSGNILMTYTMPSLPAFALLVGYGLWAGNENIGKDKCPWFFLKSRLAGVILFVPITIIIAAVAILPGVGKDNSQLGVIELFNRHNTDGTATLIYVDNMPASADFYTNGKAEEIHDGSAVRIREELNDGNVDFFAVKKDNLNSLPEKERMRTHEIGEYGEYRIFQENR